MSSIHLEINGNKTLLYYSIQGEYMKNGKTLKHVIYNISNAKGEYKFTAEFPKDSNIKREIIDYIKRKHCINNQNIVNYDKHTTEICKWSE